MQIGCRGRGKSPCCRCSCHAGSSSRIRGEEAVLWIIAQRPVLLAIVWFFNGFLVFLVFSMVFWCYLRPVRGCTSGGCDRAGGATICLGLLTFVLDLANSNRMVCGRSGSNRTPCCKKTGVRHWCCGAPLQRAGQGWQERDVAEQPHFPGLKSWPSEANWGRKGAQSWLFWLV